MQGLRIKTDTGMEFPVCGEVTYKDFPECGRVYYCDGQSWPESVVVGFLEEVCA